VCEPNFPFSRPCTCFSRHCSLCRYSLPLLLKDTLADSRRMAATTTGVMAADTAIVVRTPAGRHNHLDPAMSISRTVPRPGQLAPLRCVAASRAMLLT